MNISKFVAPYGETVEKGVRKSGTYRAARRNTARDTYRLMSSTLFRTPAIPAVSKVVAPPVTAYPPEPHKVSLDDPTPVDIDLNAPIEGEVALDKPKRTRKPKVELAA